jgi:hypothetical protein
MIGAVVLASLSVGGPLKYFVFFAAIIAAYMALNIGANDVANNMGPSVGSRALTMTHALMIAAVAEIAGAMLAGGDNDRPHVGCRRQGLDHRRHLDGLRPGPEDRDDSLHAL